nr:VOC family protein [Phyllobacterium phragmitis]
MCVTEVRQIVRQHGVGKAAWRGKADNPFGASIPAGNAPIDRLKRLSDAETDLTHFVAGVRQYKAAFDAFEQTRSRLLFQRRNVPEDCRMAQPDALGGLDLGARLADREKHLNKVPIQPKSISLLQDEVTHTSISVEFAIKYDLLISRIPTTEFEMIGYTSLGTAGLARSERFYDALLAEFGAKQIMHMDDFIVWASENSGPAFSIHIPENGKTYSVGNGVMIALAAADQAQVDLVHARALELGGTDEGKPGFRAEGFYAAYFRDPDGNKLNIHCMTG